MPFKSDAQRAFMYSQHPEIAKRWRKESGSQTNLPKRVKGGKKKDSKAMKGLRGAKP